MDITKEIQQFNITDVAIAELADRYKDLTIKDLDDREGFALVHDARMEIKGKRVEVEKTRVALKADALEYGRRIDGEAKRITTLLVAIESRLEAEERKITDEKERIKNEARLKEEEKIKARTARLFELGMTWNGTVYGVLEFQISYEDMKAATDEQFDTFCKKVFEAYASHLKAQAEAEKAREIEKQKLAEIEAENQKLKAEKEAAEKAEHDRLAEIAQQQKLEVIRAEAAERATAEAIAKAAREAKEKAAAEEKARKDAERKAARAPDKEKLLALATTIDALIYPAMKTDEGKEIITEIAFEMVSLTKKLRLKAGAL